MAEKQSFASLSVEEQEPAQQVHEGGVVGARRFNDEEVDLVVLGGCVRVVAVALRNVAVALGAIEGGLVDGADLLEPEHPLAQVLLGAPERSEVAVGGGWRPSTPRGAQPQCHLAVVGCVALELEEDGSVCRFAIQPN